MYRNMILVAAFCLFPLPQSALAQTLVGTTFIEGQKVELFEDFSWSYVEQSSGDCSTLSRLTSFCGNDKVWKSFDAGSDEIAGAYRYDDRHYAMIIDEGVGRAEGMNEEGMQKIVVENAAIGVGVDVSEVVVSEIENTKVGDNDALRVVYSVPMEGLNLTYANTIVIRENSTHQLIVYAVGTSVSKKHERLIREFLSKVRLK